jgi:hypothetical protein
MCVQTAVNALNSPAAGWVTTTRGPVKIFPPPTGISLVAASASAAGALLAAWLAAAPLAAALLGALLAAALLAGPAGVLAALLAAGALLEPPAPQAVTTPASPTRPTPASTPRRVASESVCGSCVTNAPFPVCGRGRGLGGARHPFLL